MKLTPQKIVSELDRFIVGQDQAKKVVAVALRNRYRRMQVEEPLRSEIMPKNILMIGSTGVGKTEIARRLAKMVNAPFIKVEATKFTEVGYVGRDVESIVRDLIELAVNHQKIQAKKSVSKEAEKKATERIVNALVGKEASPETKEKFRIQVLNNKIEDKEIEIEVNDSNNSKNTIDIPGFSGASVGILNLSEMLGKNFDSNRMRQKKLKIAEAKKIIISEESDKIINQDKIIQQAISSVENDGIIFLDEIDKITSRTDSKAGEVSREGVQRDLLPLLEGTNVVTKYGTIKSDHILFIASGAFHLSKPSDLLPELQGRLPIRVEMKSLSKDDLIKILIEPEASLIKQYVALIATENHELIFEKTAIEKIAEFATKFNLEIEDIGARRLHTILEKLLEDINFTTVGSKEDKSITKIVIDAEFVTKKLLGFVKDINLANFIL
ncbi:MAG: ATP-dependent protease ATPase subunit HslU [Rickettsia sp.]|nr:ATP-dependent protease ATPase subunit HslU [Rickettsia sp.]